MPRKLTYAEQQRLARRTSDITRLQSEYQRSVQDYTAAVGQKETAFNAEMAKYNDLYSSYEGRLTAYQSRLQDYQAKAKAYADAPFEQYGNFTTVPRLGAGVYSSTKTYLAGNQLYIPVAPPSNIVQSMVYDPNLRGLGPNYAFTLKPNYRYDNGAIVGKSVTDPGAFTETFNEQSPTAPTIDISAEKAKLESDRAYTEREVDERSKAKIRAVQRANARPMLSQGVKLNG